VRLHQLKRFINAITGKEVDEQRPLRVRKV
jgi:hypothetical protein